MRDDLMAPIYELRAFPDAGGLMSYGPDYPALFRKTARHVDKILKGAKPADLPVEEPTEYELVINLQAPKSIGLTYHNPFLPVQTTLSMTCRARTM